MYRALEEKRAVWLLCRALARRRQELERLVTRGSHVGGIPEQEIREVYGDSLANWMEDFVLFIDTLPEDSKAIWRVRGFDAFGELTEWQTSEEFELQDVTPPAAPVFNYISPIENKYCQIEWKMEEEATDLKGFFISFSDELGGTWEVITKEPLRPTTLSYVVGYQIC